MLSQLRGLEDKNTDPGISISHMESKLSSLSILLSLRVSEQATTSQLIYPTKNMLAHEIKLIVKNLNFPE